jgi:hypothetical protein
MSLVVEQPTIELIVVVLLIGVAIGIMYSRWSAVPYHAIWATDDELIQLLM